nr:MAG TPA: hypothetical protein [Caudoviricetes sp.]
MANIVSNKSYRELLETRNVFADPSYCREAWKSVGTAILLSPAIGCIGDIDTREGAIESYTYSKLCSELKDIGASTSGNGAVTGRQPTELEMIFHCQAARARFDTSAAVFVRDTVGAKPIDESKVVVGRSQYEEMSDDELEALLRYRQSKTYEAAAEAAAEAAEEHSAEPEPNEGDTHTDPIADETTATIAPTADTEGDPASTIADATIAASADTADTAASEEQA